MAAEHMLENAQFVEPPWLASWEKLKFGIRNFKRIVLLKGRFFFYSGGDRKEADVAGVQIGSLFKGTW